MTQRTVEKEKRDALKLWSLCKGATKPGDKTAPAPLEPLLDKMAMHSWEEIADYRPGEDLNCVHDRIIYRRGATEDTLYFVLFGQVELWWSLAEGLDDKTNMAEEASGQFDSYVYRGECFGGISGMGGLPRQTNALYSRGHKTRLMKITRAEFTEWCREEPQLALNALEEVGYRAYCSRQTEHSLLHNKPKSRIVKCLLDMTLSEEARWETEEMTEIDKVKLHIRSLETWGSTRLGMDVETVRGYLNELVKDKYLEREGVHHFKLNLNSLGKYDDEIFEPYIARIRSRQSLIRRK